jgi:acetyl esterase
LLHPDARRLLDLIEERNFPAMNTLSPVEARAFYRDRRGFTQPPAPEVGGVLDTRCDGPHGAIALRVYRPLLSLIHKTEPTRLRCIAYGVLWV